MYILIQLITSSERGLKGIYSPREPGGAPGGKHHGLADLPRRAGKTGFRGVWGFYGVGFRVLGFWVLGFRVLGVWGLVLRVWGSGLEVDEGCRALPCTHMHMGGM